MGLEHVASFFAGDVFLRPLIVLVDYTMLSLSVSIWYSVVLVMMARTIVALFVLNDRVFVRFFFWIWTFVGSGWPNTLDTSIFAACSVTACCFWKERCSKLYVPLLVELCRCMSLFV